MHDEAALARLLAQTAAPDDEAHALVWRAAVEEAAELGARRALARLGLADEAARDDVGELRELLRAWRDAKHSVWHAAVEWVVRGALALLLIGIAVKLGFGAWVR